MCANKLLRHQNATKYLTYLVLNERKFENKQPPPLNHRDYNKPIEPTSHGGINPLAVTMQPAILSIWTTGSQLCRYHVRACFFFLLSSKILRATSHMSKEPWPWNYESPKECVQKVVPRHLLNLVEWSLTLKCSVKSYVTEPPTE